MENISLGSENSDEVVRQHTFGRLTMGMLYTVGAMCMLSFNYSKHVALQ